ncbi:MAG: tetratricopeptide repeat protein [Planctomycetes bacterium]|nr:tetratricopeptide repeat protein [Planctomycetota bacterium]
MAEKTDAAPSGESTLALRVAERIHTIAYAVLALALVAGIIAAVLTWRSRAQAERERAAENAVFQLLVDLQTQPETDALPLFDQAATDYRGLHAAARVLMMKFSYAYTTRNFPAAEEAAAALLRDYPTSAMSRRARYSLGQAQFMQDKLDAAAATFRQLVDAGNSEVFPEAKLALAQTYERQAEAARENPEEYRRLLSAAEQEYNDIIVRSQIGNPTQRGFWPQAVTLPADFALVLVKDKLDGYEHRSPAATETVREAVLPLAPTDPEDQDLPAAAEGDEAEAGPTDSELEAEEEEPAGDT